MNEIKRQILNRSVMIALIGDDEQMARHFEIEFLKQAKASLAIIIENFNSENYVGIKEEAHYLKTSASAVGAEITANLLQELEGIALQNDKAKCKQQIKSLHQSVSQVYEVIRNEG